jgi:hypothetical protein
MTCGSCHFLRRRCADLELAEPRRRRLHHVISLELLPLGDAVGGLAVGGGGGGELPLPRRLRLRGDDNGVDGVDGALGLGCRV